MSLLLCNQTDAWDSWEADILKELSKSWSRVTKAESRHGRIEVNCEVNGREVRVKITSQDAVKDHKL